MEIRKYLPSAQFALIVGSVVAAGGLVVAANYFTRPNSGGQVVADSSASGDASDAQWLATLRAIQAQSGVTLPQPADPNAVQNLLTAAQSDNVTDTVGKTLLVNLTNAKTQGLGDDVPTQDQIIADATAQVSQDRGTPTYSASDLTVAPDSTSTLHAYGNAVIAIINAHPAASMNETYIDLGEATDNSDASKLAEFPSIAAQYTDMTKELAAVPVPETLVPLHLEVVNNFARIAGTYADMQTVLTDPLRGLGGLQLYNSLIDENARVLTNIAQLFSKDAILFNKGEPGATWSLLLVQQ